MATPSRQPSEPAAILASVEPSDLKEDELLEFGIWNLDLEGGKVDSSQSLLPTLEEMVNSHKTNESAGSLKETLPIDILSYDFGHGLWTLA